MRFSMIVDYPLFNRDGMLYNRGTGKMSLCDGSNDRLEGV